MIPKNKNLIHDRETPTIFKFSAKNFNTDFNQWSTELTAPLPQHTHCPSPPTHTQPPPPPHTHRHTQPTLPNIVKPLSAISTTYENHTQAKEWR